MNLGSQIVTSKKENTSKSSFTTSLVLNNCTQKQTHMRPFEDFQKHAMREAMDRVYSWKQEHPDEYSRFSVEMMTVERNDFSCFERIFKMAAGFVPTFVLAESRKLLAPDSEEMLSADESAAAASRVVDELMGLKGYLRFGVYTETVGGRNPRPIRAVPDKVI